MAEIQRDGVTGRPRRKHLQRPHQMGALPLGREVESGGDVKTSLVF